MAESGKINAVDLANIAKLDAVDAANIAKVNGLVFSSAAFLLDTYTGAAAGYSVRRLATSATNLMRIREDAGDTETDIGYDSNNELDTAAIATHCGTANGYVVTWYDQASSNNATQGTEANQPQIYDGAAVTTNGGQPGLLFASDLLGPITSAISASGGVLIASVTSYNAIQEFMYGNGIGQFLFQPSANTLRYRGFGSDLNYTRTSTPATDQQELFCIERDSSNVSTMFLNGSSLVSNTLTGTTQFDRIGNGNAGTTGNYRGYFQEFIIWPSDESSNRTGIESNVNTYFSIY